MCPLAVVKDVGRLVDDEVLDPASLSEVLGGDEACDLLAQAQQRGRFWPEGDLPPRTTGTDSPESQGRVQPRTAREGRSRCSRSSRETPPTSRREVERHLAPLRGRSRAPSASACAESTRRQVKLRHWWMPLSVRTHLYLRHEGTEQIVVALLGAFPDVLARPLGGMVGARTPPNGDSARQPRRGSCHPFLGQYLGLLEDSLSVAFS